MPHKAAETAATWTRSANNAAPAKNCTPPRTSGRATRPPSMKPKTASAMPGQLGEKSESVTAAAHATAPAVRARGITAGRVCGGRWAPSWRASCEVRGVEATLELCQDMNVESAGTAQEGWWRVLRRAQAAVARHRGGVLAIPAAFDHNPRFSHEFRRFKFA